KTSRPALVNPIIEKEIPVSKVTSTTVTEGRMGKITASHNIFGVISNLDNLGSPIFAGNNIQLSGKILNNQSYISGEQTVYQIYSSNAGLISNNDEFPKLDPNFDLDASLGATKTSTPLFEVVESGIYLSKTERYRTEGSAMLRAI
ncbi:TPA: hypothetical protein PL523_004599, partial [Cronobacter turicensis]|nr:hypothetical protein [Cronobacter turicensis]